MQQLLVDSDEENSAHPSQVQKQKRLATIQKKPVPPPTATASTIMGGPDTDSDEEQEKFAQSLKLLGDGGGRKSNITGAHHQTQQPATPLRTQDPNRPSINQGSARKSLNVIVPIPSAKTAATNLPTMTNPAEATSGRKEEENQENPLAEEKATSSVIPLLDDEEDASPKLSTTNSSGSAVATVPSSHHMATSHHLTRSAPRNEKTSKGGSKKSQSRESSVASSVRSTASSSGGPPKNTRHTRTPARSLGSFAAPTSSSRGKRKSQQGVPSSSTTDLSSHSRGDRHHHVHHQKQTRARSTSSSRSDFGHSSSNKKTPRSVSRASSFTSEEWGASASGSRRGASSSIKKMIAGSGKSSSHKKPATSSNKKKSEKTKVVSSSTNKTSTTASTSTSPMVHHHVSITVDTGVSPVKFDQDAVDQCAVAEHQDQQGRPQVREDEIDHQPAAAALLVPDLANSENHELSKSDSHGPVSHGPKKSTLICFDEEAEEDEGAEEVDAIPKKVVPPMVAEEKKTSQADDDAAPSSSSLQVPPTPLGGIGAGIDDASFVSTAGRFAGVAPSMSVAPPQSMARLSGSIAAINLGVDLPSPNTFQSEVWDLNDEISGGTTVGGSSSFTMPTPAPHHLVRRNHKVENQGEGIASTGPIVQQRATTEEVPPAICGQSSAAPPAPLPPPAAAPASRDTTMSWMEASLAFQSIAGSLPSEERPSIQTTPTGLGKGVPLKSALKKSTRFTAEVDAAEDQKVPASTTTTDLRFLPHQQERENEPTTRRRTATGNNQTTPRKKSKKESAPSSSTGTPSHASPKPQPTLQVIHSDKSQTSLQEVAQASIPLDTRGVNEEWNFEDSIVVPTTSTLLRSSVLPPRVTVEQQQEKGLAEEEEVVRASALERNDTDCENADYWEEADDEEFEEEEDWSDDEDLAAFAGLTDSLVLDEAARAKLEAAMERRSRSRSRSMLRGSSIMRRTARKKPPPPPASHQDGAHPFVEEKGPEEKRDHNTGQVPLPPTEPPVVNIQPGKQEEQLPGAVRSILKKEAATALPTPTTTTLSIPLALANPSNRPLEPLRTRGGDASTTIGSQPRGRSMQPLPSLQGTSYGELSKQPQPPSATAVTAPAVGPIMYSPIPLNNGSFSGSGADSPVPSHTSSTGKSMTIAAPAVMLPQPHHNGQHAVQQNRLPIGTPPPLGSSRPQNRGVLPPSESNPFEVPPNSPPPFKTKVTVHTGPKPGSLFEQMLREEKEKDRQQQLRPVSVNTPTSSKRVGENRKRYFDPRPAGASLEEMVSPDMRRKRSRSPTSADRGRDQPQEQQQQQKVPTNTYRGMVNLLRSQQQE